MKKVFGMLMAMGLFASTAQADMLASMNDIADDIKEQWHQAYDDNVGTLQQGRKHEHRYHWKAGQQYAVLGLCDTECRDLNLQVYDPSGRLLDSDMEYDQEAMLDFEVTQSGEYRLVTLMDACSFVQCNYRVRIFAQNAQ